MAVLFLRLEARFNQGRCFVKTFLINLCIVQQCKALAYVLAVDTTKKVRNWCSMCTVLSVGLCAVRFRKRTGIL